MKKLLLLMILVMATLAITNATMENSGQKDRAGPTAVIFSVLPSTNVAVNFERNPGISPQNFAVTSILSAKMLIPQLGAQWRNFNLNSLNCLTSDEAFNPNLQAGGRVVIWPVDVNSFYNCESARGSFTILKKPLQDVTLTNFARDLPSKMHSFSSGKLIKADIHSC